MAGPASSPRSTIPDEDVARVREVLARELETINTYEAHARAAKTPELKDFFLHLAAEEKEHVAEALHLLRQLDAGQDAFFQNGVAPGHFSAKPGAPVASPAAAQQSDLASAPVHVAPHKLLYALEAPPTSSASPLTVGSLRRSR